MMTGDMKPMLPFSCGKIEKYFKRLTMWARFFPEGSWIRPLNVCCRRQLKNEIQQEFVLDLWQEHGSLPPILAALLLPPPPLSLSSGPQHQAAGSNLRRGLKNRSKQNKPLSLRAGSGPAASGLGQRLSYSGAPHEPLLPSGLEPNIWPQPWNNSAFTVNTVAPKTKSIQSPGRRPRCSFTSRGKREREEERQQEGEQKYVQEFIGLEEASSPSITPVPAVRPASFPSAPRGKCR